MYEYVSNTHPFISSSLSDYLFEDEPLVNRFISVPKEQSNLNCAAFMAGVVEAFLCGVQFVSTVSLLKLNTHTLSLSSLVKSKLFLSKSRRQQHLKSHLRILLYKEIKEWKVTNNSLFLIFGFTHLKIQNSKLFSSINCEEMIYIYIEKLINELVNIIKLLIRRSKPRIIKCSQIKMKSNL